MKVGACLVAILQALVVSLGLGADPIEIGPRRELLVDDFLIDSMQGQLRLDLHQPVRRELVFKTDAPWEGNASAFQSVIQDGPLYRMYYRGLHYATGGPATKALESHPWVLCYAESDDGIHWRRPKLDIAEFKDSKANNIILTPTMFPEIGGDPAHSSVFKDANPACPADEKYKLVVVGWRKPAMYALKSADGIHFSPLSREPIVTVGAFDSQNLAFWDPVRKEYREYHRGSKDGVRSILTAASKDFRHFPKPEDLVYPGAPKEELYTNQVQPYYRAPHIFMGFPMRYVDRGWSDPVFDLPGTQERTIRAKAGDDRYGTAVTDALFMTSRDGRTFRRWPEAFIRPGPRQRHSWVYGDNFVFWGMVETKSAVEDAPDEISLYATDSYWEGTATEVRRYTIRKDGFVSARATLAGGEILTKPLVFEGGNLTLNMETSAAGGVQVEIQEAGGRPIEGFALADCAPIRGDHLCHTVRWKRGGDVRSLAGKPVRLRFAVRDADLYAFQFVPYQSDPTRPDVTRRPAPAKKPAPAKAGRKT